MTPISPLPSGGVAPAELRSQFPIDVEKPGFTGKAGSVTPAGESFGAMVDRFVSGVDGSMRTARAEQAKVLTGEATSLHQAMISMQEASVAFSMMIEVRNKLVEGYQELMRMQV